VPHHLAPISEHGREQARQQIGLAPDEVMLASFGFIARYKRVDSLLEAYVALRREQPEVRCFLVGEPDPALDLPGGLDRLGLRDWVVVTGYVALEQFYRYIAACDVAVNLRYPTAGETSGALLRLLGCGKAVILSNVQPFAEWPDDVCLKVDLGPAEVPMLLHYLRRLVQDAALRRQLGENARRYVGTHHTLERSAAEYLSFLGRIQ
jgi:glycosyltransferase involved in cell wall biosynthesis